MMSFSLISKVFLLIFLLMIPAGIILIVKSRKKKTEFPTCGGCGYDLTGSTGATELCPECGGQFTVVGILPPEPGGRRVGMLALGIVLIILPVTCFGVMTIGITTAASTAQRASSQAIIVQQQVQIRALSIKQQSLATELAFKNVQLETTDDEAERLELEAAITKLQLELDSVNAEIEAVSPEQTDDGN